MIDERPGERSVSGWAAGGLAFAACVLLLIGVFQVIAGVAAVVDDEVLAVREGYAFDLGTTAWGWIHLVIGAGLVVTAIGLLRRSTWAGVTALVLAMVSAIVNFFFIAYHPFWAIVVIALDVWVIWTLTRPGAIRT